MSAFTSAIDHRSAGGDVELDYWLYRPGIGWSRVTRRVGSAEVARLASTPLLDSDVPVLVPLETFSGRDSFQFSPDEEPPWRGTITSIYPP
jgi:hypothetical protein